MRQRPLRKSVGTAGSNALWGKLLGTCELGNSDPNLKDPHFNAIGTLGNQNRDHYDDSFLTFGYYFDAGIVVLVQVYRRCVGMCEKPSSEIGQRQGAPA